VRISVHVAAPADPAHLAFSLAYAIQAFEFFATLLQVPYPFPKLDLIALEKSHGLGMEHYGAITIVEDHLLVTEATDVTRRRRILRLIGHEVCHQWIGNLVTPRSFDELWLKEGVARFLEFVAV
ncbi:unnamed protein product, partial [Phaeothamnion confervicola]